MNNTFFSTLVIIILILDPFGNIPLFISHLKSVDSKKRWKIILREHFIAFLILIVFMLLGDSFLKALGLSAVSLLLSGGIILFIISIRMIFPPAYLEESEINKLEPLIVPLAIPLIAGPSALATVMLLASQQPEKILTWISTLAIAIVFSCTILILANKFKEFLGERFIYAMEKLMGLILVALSVEMLVKGIRILIQS